MLITWCFAVDASQSQYLQAEDRGNKLKQLLVQTKKDLADSKKRVRCQNTAPGVLSHIF